MTPCTRSGIPPNASQSPKSHRGGEPLGQSPQTLRNQENQAAENALAFLRCRPQPCLYPFPLASVIPAHRGPPASEEPGPAVLQNTPQTEFFFCEPHKEGRREGRPGHKDARPGGRLGWMPVSAGPSLIQLEPHPFGSQTFGGSPLPPQPDPEPGRTWLLPLTSLASRLTARGNTPPSKCTRTPDPLHAFSAFPFTSAC